VPVDADVSVILELITEGFMIETEPELMPGHPETLQIEPADIEPDENPEPEEREK
jgi:hypothetical protein